ncbi:MAG TPA: HAMP domain-containing sensor histidine kinase [Streptomyces sp.]|nr:HAMP domain-containing sensor histidine kinase [Streptomyces sp.]
MPASAPPKPTWDPREPSRPHPWLRPTIRIRLTLLYGGMFLIAGMVLLAIIYLLAAQALHEGSKLPFRILNANAQLTSDSCPGLTGTLPSEQFMERLGECTDAQRAVALDELLQRSLMALLGLAVAAFAFGYVMAGRVLSPLGRITRTARQVASSDLHKRIELEGPDDELKELSDTFDEMLDRLDRAFTAQQRFVANASHELRTPLAINRTLLEVQLSDPEASPELQQLGKTLLATNERSEQLVEGLLLLARSENEIIDRKPVDLAEVAGQAVEQVRVEAERKGLELGGVRQPAYVQGNGVLLERVALNLVQNAVRYNQREGGWVAVGTEALPGHAALVVENTGPAVPAYEIDNLFEPFRRLRSDRTGSDKGVGLGLSIVRSVARAHGGTVTAEPREEGGLVLRVVLPV